MKLLYLLLDFLTLLVPLLFSFHPKLKFDKNFRAFFIANVSASVIFIAWDVLFTGLGVWGFNTEYVSGLYFLNLPIEEILFFTCIPFSCLFTYHCLNLLFRIGWKQRTENIFILSLCTLLFITGFYFITKLYTFWTFISLSILLWALKFSLKVNWLGKLLIIYPVLLIPFFIVNGILTGSGLEQPVVWYNDSENTGVRLFTIPLEDIFYGFELILLNVFFYEYFKNKFKVVSE